MCYDYPGLAWVIIRDFLVEQNLLFFTRFNLMG